MEKYLLRLPTPETAASCGEIRVISHFTNADSPADSAADAATAADFTDIAANSATAATDDAPVDLVDTAAGVTYT